MWRSGPTRRARAQRVMPVSLRSNWQAARLQHLIGSLEPGKRADIVIRSTHAAELMPSIDPVHQLVTVAHGANADTVLVNGRIVLREGRATLVDEADVFAKAQASVHRII